MSTASRKTNLVVKWLEITMAEGNLSLGHRVCKKNREVFSRLCNFTKNAMKLYSIFYRIVKRHCSGMSDQSSFE